MAKKLSGLKIQKLLPKTNCKECGSNTCLAFAMKLASQKAELSDCPYASEDAKEILGAASEPPVKGVALGKDKLLKLGEETVLYRHEKTFVNQTAIAININDIDDDAKTDESLNKIKDYVLDRVGELLTIDMISVTQLGPDADKFANLAKKVNEITGRPIIINSADVAGIEKAEHAVKDTGSLISAATANNANELAKIAKNNGHSLVVTGVNIDEISATTAKLKEAGFNDLVINFKALSLAEQYQINSIARRAALKQENKSVGYASICFIGEGDLLSNTVKAITEISKYGGVIVLPTFNPAQLVGLMTLRQNIYTDPQKPIQVEPKLYPIGEPTKDSPVFVTTNFSLTYFIVAGEIENSGTSAWLVIPECEGMSVLTAWAAGKFSGAYIAKFMKEINVDEQINTRDIIIPGYVAQISGELQESLPGWNVIVGPQEAADIESFVKQRLTA